MDATALTILAGAIVLVGLAIIALPVYSLSRAFVRYTTSVLDTLDSLKVQLEEQSRAIVALSGQLRALQPACNPLYSRPVDTHTKGTGAPQEDRASTVLAPDALPGWPSALDTVPIRGPHASFLLKTGASDADTLDTGRTADSPQHSDRHAAPSYRGIASLRAASALAEGRDEPARDSPEPRLAAASLGSNPSFRASAASLGPPGPAGTTSLDYRPEPISGRDEFLMANPRFSRFMSSAPERTSSLMQGAAAVAQHNRGNVPPFPSICNAPGSGMRQIQQLAHRKHQSILQDFPHATVDPPDGRRMLLRASTSIMSRASSGVIWDQTLGAATERTGSGVPATDRPVRPHCQRAALALRQSLLRSRRGELQVPRVSEDDDSHATSAHDASSQLAADGPVDYTKQPSVKSASSRGSAGQHPRSSSRSAVAAEPLTLTPHLEDDEGPLDHQEVLASLVCDRETSPTGLDANLRERLRSEKDTAHLIKIKTDYIARQHSPRHSFRDDRSTVFSEALSEVAGLLRFVWRAFCVVKRLLWDVLELDRQPDIALRMSWNVLILILLVVVLCTLPIQISFVEDETAAWRKFDRFMDIAFIIDMYMNTRTSFVDDDGFEVVDRCVITGQYITGWFVIDLLSIVHIPLGLLVSASPKFQMLTVLTDTKWARMVRILRFAKVLRPLRQQRKLVKSVEDRLGRAIVNMGVLAIIGLAMLHVMACGFHFIASFAIGNDDDDDDDNVDDEVEPLSVPWLVAKGLEDASMRLRYLMSLYWAWGTLTTGSYGDVLPGTVGEVVFSMIGMLLGLCASSYFISAFADAIREQTAPAIRIAEIKQEANTMVRMHQLPVALARRIRTYYGYVSESNMLDDNHPIINGLSKGLRQDMLLFMYKDLLRNLPFFSDKSASFMLEVAQLLTMDVYPQHELIVIEGDECNSIYFIFQGSCALLKAKEVNTFREAYIQARVAALDGTRRRRENAHTAQIPFQDLDFLGYCVASCYQAVEYLRTARHVDEVDPSSVPGVDCALYFKLSELHDKDHFAEEACLLSEPLAYSVTAMTFVRCLRLQGDLLEQLLVQYEGDVAAAEGYAEAASDDFGPEEDADGELVPERRSQGPAAGCSSPRIPSQPGHFQSQHRRASAAYGSDRDAVEVTASYHEYDALLGRVAVRLQVLPASQHVRVLLHVYDESSEATRPSDGEGSPVIDVVPRALWDTGPPGGPTASGPSGEGAAPDRRRSRMRSVHFCMDNPLSGFEGSTPENSVHAGDVGLAPLGSLACSSPRMATRVAALAAFGASAIRSNIRAAQESTESQPRVSAGGRIGPHATGSNTAISLLQAAPGGLGADDRMARSGNWSKALSSAVLVAPSRSTSRAVSTAKSSAGGLPFAKDKGPHPASTMDTMSSKVASSAASIDFRTTVLAALQRGKRRTDEADDN